MDRRIEEEREWLVVMCVLQIVEAWWMKKDRRYVDVWEMARKDFDEGRCEMIQSRSSGGIVVRLAMKVVLVRRKTRDNSEFRVRRLLLIDEEDFVVLSCKTKSGFFFFRSTELDDMEGFR